MLDDVRLYPIHAFHELPRENVRRATLSTNMTLFKHHQLVTHARGQVDVMDGHKSQAAIALRFGTDLIQDKDLVMEVEGGRGFVEKHEAWIAHQHLCHRHKLTLATRELIEVARGNRVQPQGCLLYTSPSPRDS